MITIDEYEQIREIKRPFEATGLELIAVTEELERLLVFVSYIRNAKAKGYKISSVAFRYSEYLLSKKKNYSEREIKYCHKRLNREGCTYKVGFWHYRKHEIEQTLNNL